MTDPLAVYWVRVSAPHFVAALKIEDERCIAAGAHPTLGDRSVSGGAALVFPAERLASDPPSRSAQGGRDAPEQQQRLSRLK
jgi:hypothetical protein